MAFRRILSVRSTLLARRFNPSPFTYITHHDDAKKSEDLHSSGSKMETFLNQRRSLGCFVDWTFPRTPYGQLGNGLSFKREMSTSMSEVAIAASDSALPVAAVQYLIGAVHSVTGLNWWASIAIATLLIPGVSTPLYIYVLKNHSHKLTVAMQQYVVIMTQLHATGWDPKAVDEGVKRMIEHMGKAGIAPHIELYVRIYILVSFYFAVSNMAEKVPSFKTGGILWFTDLSTPDAMNILPILMASIYLIQCELFMKTPKGVPLGFTPKNIIRALIALSVPLTMSWPNAMFCFWITSNMTLFCSRKVLRHPRVMKALGIPTLKWAPPNKYSTEK